MNLLKWIVVLTTIELAWEAICRAVELQWRFLLIGTVAYYLCWMFGRAVGRYLARRTPGSLGPDSIFLELSSTTFDSWLISYLGLLMGLIAEYFWSLGQYLGAAMAALLCIQILHSLLKLKP